MVVWLCTAQAAYGLWSLHMLSLVQLFSLCDPMDCSMPGLLSITNSRSLLKLVSIDLVTPSNHLILCHPVLLPPSIFPSIRVFSSESLLATGGQSIGASASDSVLPVNFQALFPSGLTDLISL